MHYVSPLGHYPLDLQPDLPDSWLTDKKRLDRAGVPRDRRQAQTKPEIALALLDRVRAEGLPGRVVVADAGYGVSGDFRAGLEQRGLSYVVGVAGDFVVFARPPPWLPPVGTGNGRPRTRPRLAPDNPRPVALSALAGRVRREPVCRREGTKGKLSGRFARLRVWPGHGGATGDCADAKAVWLLIEEQADGTTKYAFSNLPVGTRRLRAVRLWKSRWPVEQGYQQLKEELGLDHFEGRSWRGLHHHAAMTLLAFGFLLLERRHVEQARPGGEKRGFRAARTRADATGHPAGVATPADVPGQAGLCLLPRTATAPDPRVTE